MGGSVHEGRVYGLNFLNSEICSSAKDYLMGKKIIYFVDQTNANSIFYEF